MKAKTPLNRKLYLAFGAAILILVGLGATSYRDLIYSNESNLWVRHSHQVLEYLQDLSSAVDSSESNYRGYVLTGKEFYVESWQANSLRAQRNMATIGELTKDNRLQESRMPDLETVTAAKLQFGEMIIHLRRAQGFDAAADAIRAGAGQRIPDEFHTLVRGMEDEEQRLLEQRKVDAKLQLRRTKLVLFLGTLLGILIVVGAGWTVRRDSASRDLAEEALRGSEERFRLIVSNVKDYANIMLDTEGLIVSWNQGAERIKGYRAAEIIGQHFSRFYGAEDTRNGLPGLELKQAATTGRFEGEGWRVRKDGSLFLANVVITALRDEKGRLRGFGKITRDITARRQAEEALMKTMAELKRSNEELGQFAYVASHDLQEPLRMVASYTQLLAQRYKGRLDSDADEFIGYAVDGCNRMQRLIRDLLSYSRAGTNIGALREISGEKALEEALTNLQVTIKESGTVVTHDSLPAIMTDDAQLALLFQNLIGNAIKYHGTESPRIHVSATNNAGQEWIFSVRDNGLGIEPQYFKRIFILFQRLH